MVPKKIVCSYQILTNDKIFCENKVNHMTYLYADWQPVMCNNLFQALFTDEGAPLKDTFDSGEYDYRAL